MTARQIGIVTSYSDGYGWLCPQQTGGADLPFDFDASCCGDEPKPGSLVRFQHAARDGRPIAAAVQVLRR